MDKITRSVREMYEQFPYPSGAPTNRVGSDAELVLSYVTKRRSTAGPLRVLDAGCGRGLGLIGAATLQPDVRFHGIDLNRVALQEAAAAVAARGLGNITFQECDLMTLEGLEVPDGGYDLIISSGVLHHMTDPQAGLTRLKDVLAPHGVINLMVYALHGRLPLINTAEAIALLFSPDTPLTERLGPAREAAALGRDNNLEGTPFQNTCDVDDVEFVDRLLNVNETSYDIPMMWNLLAAAGLHFVRWIEPADWAPDRLLPPGDLLTRVDRLSDRERFHFLELIRQPPGLEMILAHADNAPRQDLSADAFETATFRLNPELVVSTETRPTPAGLRTEALTFKLRVREPVPVPKGPFAVAVMYLKDRPGALKGKDLLRHLEKAGVSAGDSRAVVAELIRSEVIFPVS